MPPTQDQFLISKYGLSNLFWESTSRFQNDDKHLSDLAKSTFQYRYPFLDTIKNPGVYILYGGRQVGKTTALKQFICESLKNKSVTSPQTFYLPCDNILDRAELDLILRKFFSVASINENNIIVIDEITFIKDWQLTIKGLIDQGYFQKSFLLITGSDKIILEDASAGFPGVNRRGAGSNIIVNPLSFAKMATLVSVECDSLSHEKKYNLFLNYLKCGGYLPAINELFGTAKEISDNTYLVYEQWIVSDIVRKGKNKNKLLDLLRVLITTYASQISYNRIAQHSQNLSVDTIIDYINHLERLGVLVVLSAFNQNSLSAFPKKDKKIYARDPFLIHVIAKILRQAGMISAKEAIISESALVETAVLSSYAEHAKPLYYIKAEGEVDFVVVKDGSFQAVEVKWTKNLRPQDLKQITKYPQNGLILSKQINAGSWQGITTENLVEYLINDRSSYESVPQP
jgi:predicted AAA+ superfamily ATPase